MFQLGDRIVFRFTGVEAEITAINQDGSYEVWIFEDADHGIAFEDDIVPSNQFKHVEESDWQKQMKKKPKKLSTEDLYFAHPNYPVHPKKEKQTAKNDEQIFVTPQFKDSPATNSGCYLVFVKTGVTHYTIYIVNDLPVSYGFEFRLLLNNQVVQGLNKVIAAHQYYPIGEFLQEQFNDRASVQFSSKSLHQKIDFKIKYNKLMKQQKTIPLLGVESNFYLLFNNTNPYLNQKQSIKDYTEAQQPNTHNNTYTYTSYGLEDIANFKPEIDLHAEKLVKDTSEYSPAQLFELQLSTLEKYLDKAVQLGISEVFIIHGLGKGKLQQAVAQHLKYHASVLRYKNEYHEKYGFGATKVVLKD